MIKLIVSDIDGTLLKKYSEHISEDFFKIIKKFREKGVLFAPASGREYAELTSLFKEIKDEIYFIGSNGSTINFKNEILLKDIIPIDLISIIFNRIELEKNFEILASSENTTYLLSKDNYILNLILENESSQLNLKCVKDITEINEDIIKLSIFNRHGVKSVDFSYLLYGIEDKIKGAISGDCWFDLMNKKTDKGNAIEFLCKKLNIKLQEVVAFGDNFNDIEMLSKVGHSYAMNSADDEVKKVANFTCERVEDELLEIYNKFYC